MAKSLGSPFWLLVVWLIVGAITFAVGSFQQIISYIIFAAVSFIGLAAAGLFVLRRRDQENGRPPILAPGYPFTPFAFLLGTVLLLVLIGIRNPRGAVWGDVNCDRVAGL